MPEPARPCAPSLSRPPAGRVAVQVIRHAPTTDVSCTGMSPLQAPLPATRALDARFKERYETMRSIHYVRRRNICAARTRIGHRALRERRPPPRGTRGTVTAVACPHLSLSFPSTAGASSARLPTRHTARHAVACSGPAVRPSSWPTPDRLPLFPSPQAEGARRRCRRLRSLLRPERAERGQGEISESGEDRERWAGLRSGPDGATAPRAYARSQANGVSARRLREMINLAPAVEGNERRHIRHIFRAGFAGRLSGIPTHFPGGIRRD